MTRVLITGFEPFKDAPVNPSWDAVELLAREWDGAAELVIRRLPVVFGDASRHLSAHIAKHLPDVVIAVGVAEGTSAITLERIALNLDAATIPDNAGYAPRDVEVVPGGPLALPTTLPVREIEGALTEYGIPVRLSTSAGSYVCNHTFYALQKEVEGLGIPSGFIHVPATESMQLGAEVPTLPLETIAQALGIAIEVTLYELQGAGRDVQRRPARLAPPAMAGPYSPTRTAAAHHEPVLADDDEPTQGYIPPYVEGAPAEEDQPTQAFIPAWAPKLAPAAAGQTAVMERPEPASQPTAPAAQGAPAAQEAQEPATPDPTTAPQEPWLPDPASASSPQSEEKPRPALTWDQIISGHQGS